jgi:hypothetical protein
VQEKNIRSGTEGEESVKVENLRMVEVEKIGFEFDETTKRDDDEFNITRQFTLSQYIFI